MKTWILSARGESGDITYMHEIEVFTVGEDPSAHDPSARVPASGENLP